MIYGLIYLAMGCLMALCILIFQGERSKFMMAYRDLRIVNRRYQKRMDLRTLIASLAKMLWMVCCLVCMWPVAAYRAYKEWQIYRHEPSLEELLNFDPDPELVVVHADLVERLSQDQIEQRELIDDPLNAVPKLAFGHLHSHWLAFLASIDPLSELWSYEIKRTNYWNEQLLLRGYVAVKSDGTISKPFRTDERVELASTLEHAE